MFALGTAAAPLPAAALAAVRKLRVRARRVPNGHGEIRSRAARPLRAEPALSDVRGRGACGGPPGRVFPPERSETMNASYFGPTIFGQ